MSKVRSAIANGHPACDRDHGRPHTKLFVAALALLVSAAAAPAPSAPALDHAYVVLDRATFDAIRTSASLAAVLGTGDTGLPAYAPPRADADRIFLRGRQTYLEFFAPQNRFNEPVGKVGIGIGTDERAAFEPIKAGWRTACNGRLTQATIEWTKSTRAVPWYDVAYCAVTGEGSTLALWAMRYRQEFARWLTGAPDTSRRALLATRHGRFEVIGLTLDVTPALYRALVVQLVAGGLKREDAGDGARMTGDGWSLSLFPAARTRLRAIDLAINRSSPPVILGSARFIASGSNRAMLRFN